jgi:hypothetical protein
MFHRRSYAIAADKASQQVADRPQETGLQKIDPAARKKPSGLSHCISCTIRLRPRFPMHMRRLLPVDSRRGHLYLTGSCRSRFIDCLSRPVKFALRDPVKASAGHKAGPRQWTRQAHAV